MGAAENLPDSKRLISQLLTEDPGLRDIVGEFVAGLGARIAELRQARERMDWELLTTLAHRLKGAAGSYGYPEIGNLCAEMERQFRAHQADEFAEQIASLAGFADAARAGLDDPPTR
jgi:HPt (histidine-containing phosphotransfer) domain-containing protein